MMYVFDIQEVLNDVLSCLLEVQKIVLLLCDYEGYSYDEIVEIIGLNELQVKVYIFRVCGVMKVYIKDLELVV